MLAIETRFFRFFTVDWRAYNSNFNVEILFEIYFFIFEIRNMKEDYDQSKKLRKEIDANPLGSDKFYRSFFMMKNLLHILFS